MVIRKGEVWWASLEDPLGSGPGFRRPVVVIQSNQFNESNIKTVIVAIISSNINLAKAPGDIKIGKSKSVGLSKESVINISQLYTIDKRYLTKRVGKLNTKQIHELNDGLKLVLAI